MSDGKKIGHLYGVGIGPGDPELMTLKALRVLRQAHVIAYPTAKHGRSNARSIACAELLPTQIELPMMYPVTTEQTDHPGGYEAALAEFYDAMAVQIAEHLEDGRDVAILCEGDPFFYGSYMYLHDRLAHRFPTQVIPGIPSVMGAAAQLGMPLVRRDSELTVLPGTLSEDALAARLNPSGAFAIIKLGRNFTKVKNALQRAGVADKALYIERATMGAERIVPLAQVDPLTVPYFSLILVPDTSQTQREEALTGSGWISVVGLGPGAQDWITPEAQQALTEGYRPDRLPYLSQSRSGTAGSAPLRFGQ